MCDNLNPPEGSIFNGVDHSWKSDVFDVTEEDIASLAPNAIAMYIMATPCEYFSKLRPINNHLAGRSKSQQQADPRPGLRGKKDSVTVQSLQVWVWILKYNPHCELLAGNAKFDVMKEDLDAVCKILGVPLILDAADVSHTRRVRAWWSNLAPPADLSELTAGYSPGDPNSCMDPGRIIEPCRVDSKVTVRMFGGSWSGDAMSPVQDTAVSHTCPPLIKNEKNLS